MWVSYLRNQFVTMHVDANVLASTTSSAASGTAGFKQLDPVASSAPAEKQDKKTNTFGHLPTLEVPGVGTIGHEHAILTFLTSLVPELGGNGDLAQVRKMLRSWRPYSPCNF